MSRLKNEVVCDGCGRAFDANTPPAELGAHRDYCGHCLLNRRGDFEVERHGRRVLASVLDADPAALDPPPPAPEPEPARAKR